MNEGVDGPTLIFTDTSRLEQQCLFSAGSTFSEDIWQNGIYLEETDQMVMGLENTFWQMVVGH